MILSFDIGGTAIKFGIINNQGKLTEKYSMATDAHLGGPSILLRIIDTIHDFKHTHEISGIAISSAGVIDPIHGIVLATTDTMKDYAGIHLKEEIEKNTGIFTTVENDVNCAALAESVFGNPPLQDFLAMTIGTGIGGAIVVNGKIVHGNSYSAGEWGRMLIHGIPYEKLASLSSLLLYARELGLQVNHTHEVFEKYDQKDPIAVKVIDRFYQYLADGIVNLIYTFNPSHLVIGGGISNRGDQFILELRSVLKQKIEPYFIDSFDIQLATLKNDSGMLGAFIHHQFQQRKK
jgi:predicted NBD/HSP70 family sugar kinase